MSYMHRTETKKKLKPYISNSLLEMLHIPFRIAYGWAEQLMDILILE